MASLEPRASRGPGKPFWPSGRRGLRMVPRFKSNSKTGRFGPQSLQRPWTAVLALGPERPQNCLPLLKVIAKLAGFGPRASRGPGRPFWPSGGSGLRMVRSYCK